METLFTLPEYASSMCCGSDVSPVVAGMGS